MSVAEENSLYAQFVSLQELLSLLESGKSFHISVNDVSGILQHPVLQLDQRWSMHSMPICYSAKATTKGLRKCLDCKAYLTRRVIRTQADFCGECAIGLYEYSHPVIIDGKIMCILSIGNIIRDKGQAEQKIKHTCRRTQCDAEDICSHFAETAPYEGEVLYRRILSVVESYMRAVYLISPTIVPVKRNWCVEKVQEYASVYYDKPLTLNQMARLNFVHPKYLGKIFRRQVGMSFHQYLNDIRLTNACYLLEHTDRSVIEIALSVGYETVTYFNRLFRKQFSMSPTDFRRAHGSREAVKKK